MEWNHPYFASPSPAADGQTRWPWLGPGRSLVWAPRAPYREHVGPNRSRKLCGAFESCLENPVIFCVIEAGNFHSVEELYKKKKRHWLFPEEKCIFHLSEGERWGDILGQGNVKSIWVRVLCLYNYLIFCPKYNLPVRWEVVSQPS